MNIGAWFTLIVLNLAGAASPGPDVVLITRTATRSRRHAVAVTAGIQTGVVWWGILTVFGAAALLSAYPDVLGFVQVLGGAWLAYLGVGMLRNGVAERKNPPRDLVEAEMRLGTLGHAYRHGLVTNLSNPKIVLFLTALIAPLLPRSPSVGLSVALVLALSVSSAILQFAYATLVSTQVVRARLLRAGPYIDIVAGIFFIIAAVMLVVNGVQDLAA